MPSANENHLQLTWGLRQVDGLAVLSQLSPPFAPPILEALVELVHQPPSVRAGVRGAQLLAGVSQPLADDALAAALEHTSPLVRLAGVEAWRQRDFQRVRPRLRELLEGDPSWLVRRAALEVLAQDLDPSRWVILAASDDPHWRVRHALLEAFSMWGVPAAELDSKLAARPPHPRVEGLRQWLRYLANDEPIEPLPPAPAPSIWDGDPAVLARELAALERRNRVADLDQLLPLLAHEEEQVRKPLIEAVLAGATSEQVAEIARMLDDRRRPAWADVAELLSRLDLDRVGAACRLIFDMPAPSPGQWWFALTYAGAALAPQHVAPEILDRASQQSGLVVDALSRCAVANHAWASLILPRLLRCADDAALLGALGAAQKFGLALEPEHVLCWSHSENYALRAAAAEYLAVVEPAAAERFVTDPVACVRSRVAAAWARHGSADGQRLLAPLGSDPHPHVRALALSVERAAELVGQPELESSWHVRLAAAARCKVPAWKLEPAAQPAAPTAAEEAQPSECCFGVPPTTRTLGSERWAVAPLGISGHYGLPVEGYHRALAAGVNLLFWEPNYDAMTRFATEILPADRTRIRFVAGTFEAEPRRIRNDVERVLRRLRLERLPLFLLFWTRSWRRISPEVRDTLEQLQRAGKLETYGLSTHSRPLAVEALGSGWNPVMVRYSAAHRGAEHEVFPGAQRHGVGLLAFNATCYGRLLRPRRGPRPTAADCYRFVLAQPAVSACWSAPASLEELEENLQALQEPKLPADRRQLMEAAGAEVYRDDTAFTRAVRNR